MKHCLLCIAFILALAGPVAIADPETPSQEIAAQWARDTDAWLAARRAAFDAAHAGDLTTARQKLSKAVSLRATGRPDDIDTAEELASLTFQS